MRKKKVRGALFKKAAQKTQATPRKKAAPKRQAATKPTLADETRRKIDDAVTRVRGFVDRKPQHMLLLEELKPSDDRLVAANRIAESDLAEYVSKRYLDPSSRRLGTWAKPLQPEDMGYPSDFQYFYDCYRSLTWLIHPKHAALSSGFELENMSGSVICAMAIPVPEFSKLGQRLMAAAENDDNFDPDDFDLDEALWAGRGFSSWLSDEVDRLISELERSRASG